MRVTVAVVFRVCTRVSAAGLIACAPAAPGSPSTAPTVAEVRAELVRLYEANGEAYKRGDLGAVMRLRAPDFHALTSDGQRRDRAAMEEYIQGIMNGIRKWNSMTLTIDSLHVVGDTAFAIVSQHLDRMALRPDNEVHHVETWVTQRETWVRHGGAWLMWRVDQLSNQRRLVDGRPG
jgi:ketosteroid isomerase-like protein